MVDVRICDFESIQHLSTLARRDNVTIKKHEKQIYWGAFINDKTVGCAAVHCSGKLNILKSCFVLPEYRKSGIGKRLVYERIQYLDDIFTEHKIKTLSLKPDFYIQIGFSVVSVKDTSYGKVHTLERGYARLV
jgi:N-acetylglutamate synthase-like GNAT family acetyltransferase